MFDVVQGAVYFNQRTGGVDRLPGITKKRLLMVKYEKHSMSSFEKTKSTQTSESVCAEKIEQVKKKNFEMKLIKLLDSFL